MLEDSEPILLVAVGRVEWTVAATAGAGKESEISDLGSDLDVTVQAWACHAGERGDGCPFGREGSSNSPMPP